MRSRSHRRNLVVWSPSDRYVVPRVTRSRRIRWWLRTGALLTIVGIRRLTGIAWARRRSMFVVAGAVLVAIGITLPSAGAFVPGIVMLLSALARGQEPSRCPNAAQLTGARWRG